MTMPLRLALFIDAQNAVSACFALAFSPILSLARMASSPQWIWDISSQAEAGQAELACHWLEAVRVYSGRPNSSKDPRTYAAHRKQTGLSGCQTERR